ncbi:hypothetical protein EZH22_30505 (plasmid) [Xanthobacter dioxanivorans]|uniref:Chromosomal replication initiator DnaA C-terminal domain-containing protein n=3 Tax=Xanthobacter TaxID=279 RepID=A0A974SL17_9HYPH|nr:helix-turn-helix domain-containing protein [Xanthobacter dioxanivorans]QRG10061.1 hypothetical protein EZH22_30505 [Xanthobacter dioxanivorans]
MLSSHNRPLALQPDDPSAGLTAQELRARAREVHQRLRPVQTPRVRPRAAVPVARPLPELIVRGMQNDAALAAIEMLAARKIPGPLYIWGGRGLGKTTIAQASAAICPAAKVIDDADRWHEIAACALIDRGPLILTGPRPPGQLEQGELGTLLTHALVVELRPFDRDFALALATNMITAQQLHTPSLQVPPAVLDTVVNVPDLDGHKLAGLLKGLAFAAARGEELTPATVERLRNDLIDPHAVDSRITIRLIQRVVAEHFGITTSVLISHRRHKTIVEPRQIAVALCKRMTPRSMPEIGRMFLRDHTTILHAIRKLDGLEVSSPEMRRLLALLAQKVRRQADADAMARYASEDA